MAVLWAIQRVAFFPILLLPMLVYGRRHLDEPRPVFGKFQNIRRGKILRAVWRWIAQWLEQPGMNQRRNIVRLAVQHPARLFRRETQG